MRLLSRYGTDRPVDLNRSGVPRGMRPGIGGNPTSSRYATETAAGALPGSGAVSSASRNSHAVSHMALGSSLLVACLVVMTALITLLLPVPSSAQNLTIKGTQMVFCPDDDGFSGAPQGTIQNPTLLNGYAHTVKSDLGCKVAGVDYAVGIPTAKVATLRDWRNYSAASCYIANPSTDNAYIRCSGANPTIDNVDFSLGTWGAGVYMDAAVTGTVTITNSKFRCGSGQIYADTILIQATTSNLILKNNDFDGTNCGGMSAFLNTDSVGTVTVWYNAFVHSGQHIIEVGTASSGKAQTVDYRYNYIANNSIIPTAHMNHQQLANGQVTDTVAHNTSLESVKISPGEGYQFYFNGTGNQLSPVFRYNTMIAKPDGGLATMSYMVNASNSGEVIGTGLNTGNYFDTSGCISFNDSCAYYPGHMVGWTSSGNRNMTTGATITPK
jgi:hypothetical protein